MTGMLADEVTAELQRRQAETQQIHDLFAEAFQVVGEHVLTKRSDVQVYITGRLGVPLRPDVAAKINAAIAALGIKTANPGNVPHFVGVARIGAELPPPPPAQTDGPVDWNALLASEGMPAELPFIPRGSLRDVDDQPPAGPRKRNGVWRQAVEVAAARSYADALLTAAERLNEQRLLEQKIVELRAEGLAYRTIGERLGVDKMVVSRTLRRIARRLTRQARPR